VPTPSPKSRFPQYRIFSSKDSRQYPPYSPPHPLLSSSLSTASSTSPRSHPPAAHRFKTAFVRLLPRRHKKGVLSSSSSLSLPSFRNKAWRFSSSSSASCATVTASSFSAVSSCVGNSMFHAGASRADSSAAEAHPLHPSSGSVACCFHDPFYSSPSTAATAASTPVMSTIHPLEITAPACFPGTGPEDIASKFEQLQQLQQSSTRPSVQRANLQRQKSSQQHHQQHRVLACPPASIGVTATGSNVGGGGGRRHLIPHHHHLQGIAGLGLSGGTSTECVCPSTPGAPVLSCCTPPSPSISTAPLQISLPNTSRSSIANDRRFSLSGRSMDEMEVVSATTLQQQPPPPPSSSHHRASLTVHSSASSLVGACLSPSFDRQRRRSSQSTTSSLVVLRPKILQPQSSSSPLYPYQGDRKSSVASITTLNSTLGPEKSTTSTLGQGYDISTMFQVGPLTPSSPPLSKPFSSQSVAAAPTVMAT